MTGLAVGNSGLNSVLVYQMSHVSGSFSDKALVIFSQLTESLLSISLFILFPYKPLRGVAIVYVILL